MIQELRQSAHVDVIRERIFEVNAICPELVTVLFPEFADEYFRQRSANVDPGKDKRQADKRKRIESPLKGWLGCESCGDIWPERLAKVHGVLECPCMWDLDDTRGDCWVGPPNHKHRQFEERRSSPFWTDQPDPQNPEYCLPNEVCSDKPKQSTWLRDLEWKGRKYAQVCRCGMQHIVPSEHPVCPPSELQLETVDSSDLER